MAPGVNLVKWYPPGLSSDPTPADLALHIRLLYNATNDHDQAITTLKQQQAPTATTTTVITAASAGGNPGPPAATIMLETNGALNAIQSLLNLISGANITLTADGAGGVTIAATSGSGPTLETNSVVNASQSLLNLIQGSNVTITDGGAGNITIASTGAGPTLQTNTVNNSSQSVLNLIQGTNVTITSGVGGAVTIAAATSTVSAYVPRAKTANYTAVANDSIFCDTSAGGFTITLPAAASNSGVAILVKKISSDANTLAIARTGGDVIDGATSASTILPFSSFFFVSDGVSDWGIF